MPYLPNWNGLIEGLQQAIVAAGGTFKVYDPNWRGAVTALEDLKNAIAAGGGGTTNHAALTNLSYAASGHTGFAKSGTNADITSLTGITGSTTVGGKKHTRSSVAPTTPATGDTWQELDGSGNIIGGWFWNGTYWLSLEKFTEDFVRQGATSTRTDHQNIQSPNYNIFVEEIRASVRVATTTGYDATNYWTFMFGLMRTAPNVQSHSTTSIGSLVLNSANVNTTYYLSSTVNAHFAVSVGSFTPFIFRMEPTGSPSAMQASSMSAIYRLARQ